MKSDEAEDIAKVNDIRALFNRYPGKLLIYIHIVCKDNQEKIVQVQNIRANTSRELLVKLREKLGSINVWLKA